MVCQCEKERNKGIDLFFYEKRDHFHAKQLEEALSLREEAKAMLEMEDGSEYSLALKKIDLAVEKERDVIECLKK